MVAAAARGYIVPTRQIRTFPRVHATDQTSKPLTAAGALFDRGLHVCPLRLPCQLLNVIRRSLHLAQTKCNATTYFQTQYVPIDRACVLGGAARRAQDAVGEASHAFTQAVAIGREEVYAAQSFPLCRMTWSCSSLKRRGPASQEDLQLDR